MADELAVLRTWVVTDRLAYFDSPLHPPGILDRSNADDFHGAELRTRGWDFALCAGCHSDDPPALDFAGGSADRSCLTCHDQPDGPTACSTCHDQSTGAHPTHLVAGELDRAVPCDGCHRVPARWDDPGHILADGVVDPFPAEVELGALANRDVEPPRRTAPASYDPATGSCSNVYCHGGILGDTAAAFPAPVWTSTDDQAACGACHGGPPANHASASTACTVCHAATVAVDGTLVTAVHLDGVIDVGDRAGDCSACHGDATSPAPPRALDGATLTSAATSHARACAARSSAASATWCRPRPRRPATSTTT
jgi:predicted CxxxxCH...CXXCH cytochrome family protein